MEHKMKKLLKLFLLVVVICGGLLLLNGNEVYADVEYTRVISSGDGSITIKLTGITLEVNANKSYSYALTEQGGAPTTWHNVTEYTANTAEVLLNSATNDIVEVLKATDKGLLYIKDNTDNSYVVDGLTVDLKLPYLQAIPYSGESYYNIGSLYGSLGTNYLGKNTHYKWTKVTDRNFIEKFLAIKNSSGDITELEGYLPSVPQNGYDTGKTIYYNSKYSDGLYILWVKLKGDDCKTVVGAIIHDGLPAANKLEDYLASEPTSTPTPTPTQTPEPTVTPTPAPTEKPKDDTTLGTKLPQTGVGIELAVGLIVITIIRNSSIQKI